ncbi:efflux transporter outer membrane subunit [Aquabacterium sp. OR-4]|uniref:efflux transporter outer membrane subunit n=1 Tax=Aquabacterium sp. OR-4 TaxID=2978127 RepID=UPI0028C74A85|nr:efflux transporter outer membrane subunit [Aquabacterium sp. OR-4]MDT7837109.1 efflux transporter outer membrane subunit [Aquabacterium sp. OR-4]
MTPSFSSQTAPPPPGRCARGLTFITASTAVAAAALLLLLGGCASPGPQAQAPLAQPVTAAALGATGSATPWPAERWWQAFGDAPLDALVQQALAGQPGLRLAQARLQQARAALGSAEAAQGPQASLAIDMTDQRFTAKGLVPAPVAGNIYWNNSATLSGSWELDLFGRQRAALEAAIGQARAAEAETQAARVLLAGNLSAAWVDLARQLQQRALAQHGLALRLQLQQLVGQRLAAGLDTQVELRQADGGIAQARLELAQRDEAIGRSRRALAELAGLAPDALATLSPTLASLPAQTVPAALPADLLGRRADLVAQRWRVEAALRDVDVARAQFYPNISLNAFVGLSSLSLDNFLSAGAQTYGIGPALRLPVFDGGRLRANLGARRAEVDAAVAGYDSALLRALREVADELASLQSLAAQTQAQAEASSAAEAALALARQRAQAGLGTRLAVVNAELGLLAQRRTDLELQARHLASQVALARALGGGWQAAPDTRIALQNTAHP